MTPLDIKKRSFTTAWRGYDPGQVQTFLESVAREFEEQYKQNAQLQEKLKASEERVYQYRLIEKTLQDAAITLQQTLDEKRKTAEQEGELILQQARQRAEEESQTSREKAAALRTEVQALEDQKRQLFQRLQSLLQGQLQTLESMKAEEVL
ncbi:MAG TPA: hypothetical protein DCQ83_08445 [Fibrobacteres bacterium]|jgi:cell division initiation protein|nr:hypothetical protein [Fibrobacterota bacterium]